MGRQVFVREDREEQPRFGPAATDGFDRGDRDDRGRGGDRGDRGRDRDSDRQPRGDFYRGGAGDRGDRDRDRGGRGEKTQVFVSNVSIPSCK